MTRHYPDMGSDASSVWNFCARFWDVILAGKPVVASRNIGCFFRLELPIIMHFFPQKNIMLRCDVSNLSRNSEFQTLGGLWMTPTIKSLISIHKLSIELILRSFLNHKGNKGRCKESTIRGHRKNLSPRWDSQSEGIFWFIILLIYRHRRNTRFFPVTKNWHPVKYAHSWDIELNNRKFV